MAKKMSSKKAGPVVEPPTPAAVEDAPETQERERTPDLEWEAPWVHVRDRGAD